MPWRKAGRRKFAYLSHFSSLYPVRKEWGFNHNKPWSWRETFRFAFVRLWNITMLMSHERTRNESENELGENCDSLIASISHSVDKIRSFLISPHYTLLLFSSLSISWVSFCFWQRGKFPLISTTNRHIINSKIWMLCIVIRRLTFEQCLNWKTSGSYISNKTWENELTCLYYRKSTTIFFASCFMPRCGKN